MGSWEVSASVGESDSGLVSPAPGVPCPDWDGGATLSSFKFSYQLSIIGYTFSRGGRFLGRCAATTYVQLAISSQTVLGRSCEA